MAYRIYVNDGTKRGGYLCSRGLTPWIAEATPFPTLDVATAEIKARGWANDTSVHPGRVTAYVTNAVADRAYGDP